MKPSRKKIFWYVFGVVPLVILITLWCCPLPDWGMGLDFGGGGSTTSSTDLVITPGPIESPMRITPGDNGIFFVSDYQGEKIVSVSRAAPDNPETVLSMDGHPLGIVYTKKFMIVGNDSTGTIDVYHMGKGKKIKSFQTAVPIQASDLAFDENDNLLFVADSRNHEVKVFTLMGDLVGSFGLDAPLTDPKGIAIDPVARQVFVTDYGDPLVGIAASINVFDYDGKLLKRFTGAFSRPQGILVDAGRIYFVDAMLGQVLILDRATGARLAALGSFGVAAGSLLLPMDLTRDEVSGKLLVTNYRMGRVDVFTPPNP